MLVEFQGGALLEQSTSQAAVLAAEDEEDFEDGERQRAAESGSEDGSDNARAGVLEDNSGMAAMMAAAARSQHAENGGAPSMGWTPMSGGLNRPGLGHPSANITESEMDMDGQSNQQGLDDEPDSFSEDRGSKMAQDGLSKWPLPRHAPPVHELDLFADMFACCACFEQLRCVVADRSGNFGKFRPEQPRTRSRSGPFGLRLR